MVQDSVEESLTNTELRNARRASKLSTSLIQAAATMYGIQRDLARLADSLVRVKVRQSTREQIEQATWAIHSQAREGREEMDSNKHAALIRVTIERAIIAATQRAEAAELELSRRRRRSKD